MNYSTNTNNSVYPYATHRLMSTVYFKRFQVADVQVRLSNILSHLQQELQKQMVVKAPPRPSLGKRITQWMKRVYYTII